MSSPIIVAFFGLIFGSFLTSFTYRVMHGERLPKGRSYCPKCKNTIRWYDNIPLLSYFFLMGKCRNCKKPISLRYPFIEFITALGFSLMAYELPYCATGKMSPICEDVNLMGVWTLPFLLVICLFLIAIFVTDVEYQIIPDEISFAIFAVTLLSLVLSSTDTFYVHLLVGFGSGLFFLLLHLVTLGRGMGLGDVKLALGLGTILGWPHVLSWLMSSFVLGAFVGVSLTLLKKAKLGRHIAFGPFLVISFFIVLFWGDTITGVLFPYL